MVASEMRDEMAEVIDRLRARDDYAYGDGGDAQIDGQRLADLALRIIEQQDTEIALLRGVAPTTPDAEIGDLVMVRTEDAINGPRLQIRQADRHIRIHSDVLRAALKNREAMECPWVVVSGPVEVGAVVHINAENRSVAYRLCGYEAAADCYTAERLDSGEGG